ncbi:hypothetical protein ACOSP7_009417 [Xanthoceras sorbifolium]
MKKIIALFFVLLLLLASPSAGGIGKSYEHQVVCNEKFDMMREPYCSRDSCKALCVSKHFYRLSATGCLDSITCHCTHLCRPPPPTNLINEYQ